MRGAIPPLSNTSSCRGAQLKHRDTFTLPFVRTYKLDYKTHIYIQLTEAESVTCYKIDPPS
jgi:hypothetical protein